MHQTQWSAERPLPPPVSLTSISAIHTENGEEKLNLLMIDDAIPAGAKLG